ncbi:LuxR C-terminal-related transcriptional regulator [Lysinibacillus fusiformis]|uniref:LuxR C-terminal-related transcriptional regulator n=1 Tax=Lysinibacillus fusiformis TaxID=28031 RepID=UPI00088C68A6|nr:LuxR C-terminal-related transcriptional regulator [Lysinibacillus fusiformis]SCX52104.1 regulatory protein, luxR family [Lysinibacillus fusiformis]SDB27688.1 regulatory protein, luxR family [Lysinibacillus fusiformis]SFI21843.1 regulatory protein, luxR family [Lysinibacillus fusiformis]SFS82079.1 regulatory protein, luxR family [Lysinibacillus fusiformis]
MLKERTLTITPDALDSMITDYHWMVNAIKEMRSEMVIGAKTAQYGIEATLPKAAGGVGDPIQLELNRRFRHSRRIKDYEHKILEVQQRVDKVIKARDAEILFWLLEGKSMRWIGRHMNLSHTNIQLIRKNIISNMIS